MFVMCYSQIHTLSYTIKLIALHSSGLQIYGGSRSLSHVFKIWPNTFQGSGPSGPILFSCEKITLIQIFILQRVYQLHKTESSCR